MILLDCHSMPSTPAQHTSPRPDFVIGDRFGVSCDPKLSRALREKIIDFGYDVQMNRPYAGGYITEHYGRPTRGIMRSRSKSTVASISTRHASGRRAASSLSRLT